MRYFLFAYLLVYFAVAFVLPTYRVWKRTGANPVTFKGADTAHDYIGRLFKIVMLTLTIAVMIYTFAPTYYEYFVPMKGLDVEWVQLIGIILLLISLGWTIAAQIQMGNSWRIGIDEEKRTDLVQTGLFRVSRNPIFLGMQIALLGFFFVMPNMLTVLILVVGVVLIQVQVRLEEEFLLRSHGGIYEEYRKTVRRWI